MANENVVFKYLKNMKSKWTLILLCLVGVAMLLAGKSLTGTKQAEETTSDYFTEAEKYRISLQNDIKQLCSEISGVGEVEVMVVLSSGDEYVYAQNTSDGKSDYVTYSGNGILISRKMPKVGGVAIVCDGGDNPEVKMAITDTIAALLGLNTTKISVSKKI